MRRKNLVKNMLSIAITTALFGINTAQAETVTCGANCSTQNFNFVDNVFTTSSSDGKQTDSYVNNNVVVEDTANATDGQLAEIYGAYRNDGKIVKGNQVTVEKGTVKSVINGYFGPTTKRTGIYGGVSQTSRGAYGAAPPPPEKNDVKDNHVTVKNANLTYTEVYGGRVDEAYGGAKSTGEASNNTVTIENVTLTGAPDGFGGNYFGSFMGGRSYSSNAKGNTLKITDSTLEARSLIGGYSNAENGAEVSGNSLELVNSIVNVDGEIAGGYGNKQYRGETSAKVTNNTVTITGGEIKASAVYGGWSEKNSVTNNTVTIKKGSSNPVFTDTTLYGGQGGDENTNDLKTGNTLNVHTTGLTVKNIKNFEKLNFYAQRDTANDATFLTLTETADTDIKGAKVGIGVEGSNDLLKVGDKLTLIKKERGKLLSNGFTQVKGMQGVAAIYDFKVKKEGENLIAETLDVPSTNVSVPFETIYEADPTLDKGVKKTLTEGKEGVKDSSGKLITPAVNKVVKVGTKPTIKTEKIPFITVKNDDANLYVGNTKVITNGVEGVKEIKTTYTVDKKTGKVTANTPIESTKTEKVNKVIAIGVKDDILFGKKYVADPSLDKGVTKISTPGKKGVKIKGKVTTPATDEVIKVGTKPTVKTEKIPFVTVKNDDANLYVGNTKVITNGVEGVKEIKTTYTVDAKTGKLIANKPTESIKTPKTDKVIAVGVKGGIAFNTKYVADPTLDKGVKQVVTKGKQGVKIKGKVTTPATDEVIKVGTKPTVKTEKIPFITIEKDNTNMNTGETQVVTAGVEGVKEIKTTYTVDAKTGKLIANKPTETIKTPKTDKVIAVGVKGDIAFNTKYVADPTLDKGVTQVVTKGKQGVKIKGKVTTPATDEVIKVGTKPTVKTEGTKTTKTTYKLDAKGQVVVDKVTVIADTKKPEPEPKPEPKIAAKINPQTKSLLENGVANIGFINRGADLANGAGMNEITQISQNDGIKTFGAIAGGEYRTKTGSHVDVKGVNLLLGVGNTVNNSAGQLHFGAYVEGGIGSYDSFNNFVKQADVKADGDTKYYGIGAMAKQVFNNNFFVEGGVSFGRSHSTYNSNDLQNAFGKTNVYFKTKRGYTGANIGFGYQADINDKISITPSLRLLYARLGRESQVIEGSAFNFDSITSLRTHLGAKVGYQLNSQTQLYGNFVWEREHKGDANGDVLGLDMPTPSIKGNTGIIGIGASFTPSENLHINTDIEGSFGKRRGMNAKANFRYDF